MDVEMRFVLNKFDENAVSVLSFNKHAFADRIFTLMLVYRKQSMHMLEFFQMLPQNRFLDIFADHVHMVNKPTHISGSLIDHVYIKKTLIETFFTNASLENTYFSDDDVVRFATEKNYDFHINP